MAAPLSGRVPIQVIGEDDGAAARVLHFLNRAVPRKSLKLTIGWRTAARRGADGMCQGTGVKR
jgi:hypothetical protein